MKTIEVVVKRDGEIFVSPKGYKGSACKQVTRALEDALGDRGATKLSPEYYERPELLQEQRR